MGRIIPYIMKNKKCLKPPTSKVVCLCEMVLVQKKNTTFSWRFSWNLTLLNMYGTYLESQGDNKTHTMRHSKQLVWEEAILHGFSRWVLQAPGQCQVEANQWDQASPGAATAEELGNLPSMAKCNPKPGGELATSHCVENWSSSSCFGKVLSEICLA